MASFSESHLVIDHFECSKHTPPVFTAKSQSLIYMDYITILLFSVLQHSLFIHCVKYGTKKAKV